MDIGGEGMNLDGEAEYNEEWNKTCMKHTTEPLQRTSHLENRCRSRASSKEARDRYQLKPKEPKQVRLQPERHGIGLEDASLVYISWFFQTS